jgi:predicted amidohydrolase YtcJ
MHNYEDVEKMKANLIIKNGSVYTTDMNGNTFHYEAVAASGGMILAVGSNDEIMKFVNASTEIVDAEGNTVLPGMCDAHLHAAFTAEIPFSVNMYGIEPEPGEERQSYIKRLLEDVKTYAEDNPDSAVVRGTGWNPGAFTAYPEGYPEHKDLDWACSDRPIILRSYCHHFLWLNSKAIEMTGITKDTPLGQGIVVGKDSGGNPTGIFEELPAAELVLDSFSLADYSKEEYKKGILMFQNDYALKNGITCIFEALFRPNSADAFKELAENGELKIRVRGSFLANPSKSMSQFDEMIAEKGKYNVDDTFRIDAIKFFLDAGGQNSLMNEPLTSEFLKMSGLPEDFKGSYIWKPKQAKEAFLKVAKAGFQIHVHCMGDRAVKEALDAFEYVDSHGIRNLRHTITHIQNIDVSDMERMARLGVVAAMQQHWGIYDGFAEFYVEPAFGKERTMRMFPSGDLVKAGVICSASTDFPVEVIFNTFAYMQMAITRSVPRSHPEFDKYKDFILGPASDPKKYCVTLDDMIRSRTIYGAYQLFLENYTGSIEQGKSADFVLLDKNIEALNVLDIETVNTQQVIIKGETVYKRQ